MNGVMRKRRRGYACNEEVNSLSTRKEKDFYVSKNYSLPKRCHTCRKVSREDAKFLVCVDEEL